eukprot:gene12900-9230_t
MANQLSADANTPLTDVEKEIFSSTRGFRRVKNLIEILLSNPRPRRAIRDNIADMIFMMERINVLAGRDLFTLQSLDAARRLKEPITADNPQLIKKRHRFELFTDLRLLYFSLENAMDHSKTEADVDALLDSLRGAGAKSIMLTEEGGSYVISVEGPGSEDAFVQNFGNLSLTDPLPRIQYTQRDFSSVAGPEEALCGVSKGRLNEHGASSPLTTVARECDLESLVKMVYVLEETMSTSLDGIIPVADDSCEQLRVWWEEAEREMDKKTMTRLHLARSANYAALRTM